MNTDELGIGNPKEAERTVRLLLHRARKPAELANFPLVFTLCSVVDCDEPALALRNVVESALRSERDVLLREIVLRCDIEGELSLREACSRYAVSRRHFQRYRARAVTAIAERIRNLISDYDGNGETEALIA